MKDAHSLISVIVPIYNVEHYLQQCIDSICGQTYRRLEIILVDDGSVDNCGIICNENAKRDARIVVIHKKNGGLSSARNAGLDAAKGEYVSFIDADDTIHPGFIEILLGLCIQYECDIAQCDFLTIAEESSRLPLNVLQSIKLMSNKQALYELCCTNNGVKYTIACNKLYRRELFGKIRYPLGKIHEDEFTTYLLVWKARKIAVTNQYLYYYLQRADGIMGSSFPVKRLDALDALKERLEFLKMHECWEEYEGTLGTVLDLAKRIFALAEENGKVSEFLYERLQKERKSAEEHLQEFLSNKNLILQKHVDKKDAKIVLYGAGCWGHACYQWIKENRYGMIVGWIDNSWSVMKENEYPISPVDAFIDMRFDYIIIAIKDRQIREEVRRNLISWGVPEQKILLYEKENSE